MKWNNKRCALEMIINRISNPSAFFVVRRILGKQTYLCVTSKLLQLDTFRLFVVIVVKFTCTKLKFQWIELIKTSRQREKKRRKKERKKERNRQRDRERDKKKERKKIACAPANSKTHIQRVMRGSFSIKCFNKEIISTKGLKYFKLKTNPKCFLKFTRVITRYVQ